MVNKGRVFREIIVHPTVLSLVEHVLQGSVTLSSLNARSANPHGDKPQQQYQKQLLDADLQAALPSELRELLALDDSFNDGLSGQDVKRSGFLT